MLVTSPILAAVGFGLFFTATDTTGTGRLLGFQILVGIGLGCATQLPVSLFLINRKY